MSHLKAHSYLYVAQRTLWINQCSMIDSSVYFNLMHVEIKSVSVAED